MMTIDAVMGGVSNGAATGERTIRVFGRWELPRDLFFVRLFYLLYFAAFGSLFPLMAVYFKQLGMTAAQTGVLLGSRPLIEFAAYPFWGSFADRFRKGKVLLLFSLGAWVVFTLAIGFVQPLTPYCVVLDAENESRALAVDGSQCKLLVPASEVIRGGALGLLKDAAGFGRRRKRATSTRGKKKPKEKAKTPTTGNRLIDKIIDLSTYDNKDDMVVGKAPEYITGEKVCNYREDVYGVLVSPPHSTRVYSEPAVEQAFMLLLILVVLGEFFSSPALALADGYTLGLVADRPKEYGNIRLFGSIGWGLAMFVLGFGLDFSDTFRNHPCPTKNTTEKNYTLCFVTCSLLAIAAMAVTSQFHFPQPSQQHRPDEVAGLAMDTRIDEVDPAVAQKTRAKQQLHSGGAGAYNGNIANGGGMDELSHGTQTPNWQLALKAMVSNTRFLLYLLGVVTVGFGAGNVFTFLYWHLQDLGGSPVLFGFASITNHAAEIITFFYTFQIINTYGYARTMYACLGANVVRFFIISWISNPWLVLPLQVMQGCVLAVVWASATSYVSLVSPPHLKATSQYILTLLYHGVGKGLGPIVGGAVTASVGSRAMFALLALTTLAVLAANYFGNRALKGEGMKYSHEFDGDDEQMGGGGTAGGGGVDETTLAPQGLPMRHVEMHRITDAFNQPAANNYGAIGGSADRNPQDEAYDRYVSTRSDNNPFR